MRPCELNVRKSEVTGIPSFLKVRFMPLHLYEGLILVPVFSNQKEFKENFQFYQKKRWKVKMASSVSFTGSCHRSSGHLEQRSKSVTAQDHIQHLSSKPPELWTVSLSACALSCASTSKMCPKVLASSLKKGFIGKLYFQRAVETSRLYTIFFPLITTCGRINNLSGKLNANNSPKSLHSHCFHS